MFCDMGSNFKNFFVLFCCFSVDEGIEDPNNIFSGPSSARQRNGR